MEHKINETKLGLLMSALIYPAFLGADFVWLFQGFATQIHKYGFFSVFNINNAYAVWLIVYFCVVFLIRTWYDIERPYNIWLFLIDVVDILIIFFGFLFLGFVVEGINELRYFYCTSIFVPIMAMVFNLYTKGIIRWRLIIPSVVILLAGASWFYNSVYFNLFAFLLLSILLLFYVKTYSKRT